MNNTDHTFLLTRIESFVTVVNTLITQKFGFFYILTGIFVFAAALVIAFSKYGAIRLGTAAKPKYGGLKWGAMIFTSTMAADILYWSLIEWIYYYGANPFAAAALSSSEKLRLAAAYPLFHWGPIPWSFYILPAAAYAYMFFVKGKRRQSLSEACRPVLGKAVDSFWGKLIDGFSIAGLIGGTATTFALATPLISAALSKITGAAPGKELTIIILLCTGAVFTAAVLAGMRAIAKLALVCVTLFSLLAVYVLAAGPTVFIIESGISGIGYMLQNLITMASWTDPLRTSGDGTFGFPQSWTIFYWAYWIAWFVATPFFIAKISEGRTIRQMILGAFICGIAGTYCSFIIFGNFGLYQEVSGAIDVTGLMAAGVSAEEIIITILARLPLGNAVLFLLAITMIAFYASTFDAITLVVSQFRKPDGLNGDGGSRRKRIFWAAIFIILPIILIWAESTLAVLKALSILAALPLAVIMLIIITGFIKELLQEKNT
jgi:BCCT family betaine/carnitine transporter